MYLAGWPKVTRDTLKENDDSVHEKHFISGNNFPSYSVIPENNIGIIEDRMKLTQESL